MISREEAIKKLKEYWGVEEFTFMAKFQLANNKGGTLDANTFGFFNELHLYKKQLLLPPTENCLNIPAYCFALKGELKSDILIL
jgi:hypothetical protein